MARQRESMQPLQARSAAQTLASVMAGTAMMLFAGLDARGHDAGAADKAKLEKVHPSKPGYSP